MSSSSSFQTSTIIKSKVRMSVNPSKIKRGQMLQVSAEMYDSLTGRPVVFKRIYMQIIDSVGVEFWPLSTIKENSSQVNKLISTAEMKGGKYTIRISPSRKLSPQAAFVIEVEADGVDALLPLIPLALLARPSGIKKDKIEKEFAQPKDPLPTTETEKKEKEREETRKEPEPKDDRHREDYDDDLKIKEEEEEEEDKVAPKIAWLIYATEKDGKVCDICKPHEGKLFLPHDPELIRIGPPQYGMDTHFNCRCHYDIVTDAQIKKAFFGSVFAAAAAAKYAAQRQKLAYIYDVYQAAKIGQQALLQLHQKERQDSK